MCYIILLFPKLRSFNKESLGTCPLSKWEAACRGRPWYVTVKLDWCPRNSN